MWQYSPLPSDASMPPLVQLPRFVACGARGDGKRTLAARLAQGGGAPVDIPGEDTRDMIAAAWNADAALVVVDASKGVTARTRRHACIASLLGIRRFVVAVNKMDLCGFAEARFEAVRSAFEEFARRADIGEVSYAPVSALDGDNVAERSPRMPWHRGPALTGLLHERAPPRAADPGAAAESADQFEATIVWMGKTALLPGRDYRITLGSQEATATVTPLKHRVSLDDLEHIAATRLEAHEIGVAQLECDRPLAFAPYDRDRERGRFTLADRRTHETLGAGMIRFALRRSQNVHWQAIDIDRAARAALKRQRPCVLWLTGISGAGKSTIANLVEKKLHAMGRHTYLLDGDNVRHGLNKDLGFTEAARVENIRRVSEVARLMTEAGLIVITAFISPFRSERESARALFAPGEFLEVFIDTPLAVAERRDPKGLYAKARRGELKNFTGIDSPYERPERAEITIDTTALAAEAAAERVVEELRLRGL